MSLFDSASLVVTPNGVKEGKLYSIKPTDGSGDLSVTRATTATRVNSAGLVELVPVNLVTYSEQFDNADWTKQNCSISANATTAPNGTLTADKLILNNGQSGSSGDGTGLRQLVDIPSGIYTYSVYAKAAEFSTIRFRENQVTGAFLTIDLNTGAITNGDTNQYVNPTAVLISNGWYRITFSTPTMSAIYKYSLRVSETGNGTSGIYVWGYQLVEGTSAKDYQKTETRLNIPRLDYTNGTCPSILVEPQRTNLWINSEDFSGGSESLVTYTANTTDTLSPSGINNADKFQVTTSGGDAHTRILQSLSVQNFSVSLYVKGNAGQNMQIFLARDGYTELKTRNFTLTGGWQRLTFSDTFTTTSSSVVLGIEFSLGSSDSVAGQIFYLWGAQIESGSYATSYIPTQNTSVTRNADVISKTGISSLIGQTEGSAFVDINLNLSFTEEDMRFITISDGSSSNWYFIGTNTTNEIRFYFRAGATTYVSELVTLTSGRHKLAFAYKNNDYVAYVDGVQIYSTASLSVGSTSSFDLGKSFGSSGVSKQFINSAILWKERLTNEQLAQLTTI
jgi:hypothetical protein